ncbi:hypothetical protein O181_034117 [Austropuccinia psidii MF-1]|uniref:Reverse transcriptase Ty1/copia-type domain-containing protein n=1 Tax=Austropuccinia psidii MF-1 TaxID=1389203 RepID=A0A9Q3D5Z6_9BASI|nr:hypothetical protein [Austropuccinia psidii MF-1]
MRWMEVFEIAPLDNKQHIINGGWVFSKKIDNLSGCTRYKARYVARGNKQYHGKEYKETFAPTATFSALRLLLTWEAKNNWLVHSFDFTAAYLNAPINMDVWIKPPDGLKIPNGMGCQLKKALYGTKQAGRCWLEHLSSKLKALDDGIVIAQTKEALERLKMGLEGTFVIKWKDGVERLIGMEIRRHEAGFTLTQKRLIESIVATNWDGKKSANTPLPPKQEVCSLEGDEKVIDQKSFLSIIGSLSYVANGTRPDISFAVNLLARHAQGPGRQHWALLQHLLGYLHNTQNLGLRIFPNNEHITVSSNASWGETHKGGFLNEPCRIYGFEPGIPAGDVVEEINT